MCVCPCHRGAGGAAGLPAQGSLCAQGCLCTGVSAHRCRLSVVAVGNGGGWAVRPQQGGEAAAEAKAEGLQFVSEQC